MLTKNRASFKSSVATVKDEFLLGFYYLLVMSTTIWSPNNKVEKRHFLFMWQQSKENKWFIYSKSHTQMLWNSNNMNSDIPTRLQRKEYINIESSTTMVYIQGVP